MAVADEAAADQARRRLREQGIVPMAPDERIGPLLAQDECLVAVRREVVVERRFGSREAGDGLPGDLYVTTRRLVLLLGCLRVDYALTAVHEVEVVARGVRLVVEPHQGVDLLVGDPRVLRVEIAAVREAIRRGDTTPTPGLDQGSFR